MDINERPQALISHAASGVVGAGFPVTAHSATPSRIAGLHCHHFHAAVDAAAPGADLHRRERVSKVLVVGPSGMQTHFWAQSARDVAGMLDPRWVAAQITTLYAAAFAYQCARILRNPARVEITETR